MKTPTYRLNQKLANTFADRVGKAKLLFAATLTLLTFSASTLLPTLSTSAQGGAGGGSTSTGGSATGGTSTGGGGGTKAPCDAFSGTTAIADTTGITASYTVALCVSGKTIVTVKFKDANNNVVYTAVDPVGNQIKFTNVVFASAYSVEFSAFSTRSNSVVGVKTVPVTTPTLPANCATNTTVSPRMGYWGVYAAVWINYSTLNCGYGMQTAEIRITNLDNGQVVADYNNMPTAYNLDFEGPVVGYNTNYQFDVIIHGAMGEVLDSSSATGVTVPQL